MKYIKLDNFNDDKYLKRLKEEHLSSQVYANNE